MGFMYLLDKINCHEFESNPFKHLEINDFFEQAHFDEITASPEVQIGIAKNDADLIDRLLAQGFEPIEFPGTTQDINAYLRWRAGRTKHHNLTICEGFGITFRLGTPKTPLLADLNEFFHSDDFVDCIADKFGVDRTATYLDNGLQKYLDGYEISPHPDIRKKALTYMINVNPGANSETENFHTHYMIFADEYKYVQEYWRHNPDSDRCWVPWHWCQTVKQQTKNNSLVMFSPSDQTLHAIRTKYDHLIAQRTQFYGNLWYHQDPALTKPSWSDYVISASPEERNYIPFKQRLRRLKALLSP